MTQQQRAGDRSYVTGSIHGWIAFDISTGWLRTRRAQPHFVVFLNYYCVQYNLDIEILESLIANKMAETN